MNNEKEKKDYILKVKHQIQTERQTDHIEKDREITNRKKDRLKGANQISNLDSIDSFLLLLYSWNRSSKKTQEMLRKMPQLLFK